MARREMRRCDIVNVRCAMRGRTVGVSARVEEPNRMGWFESLVSGRESFMWGRGTGQKSAASADSSTT